MFTLDEIKMLTDGLDALVEKPIRDEMISSMFKAVLGPKSVDEVADETEQHLAEIAKNQEGLKERIILLKAKLIGIKDKAIAEDFAAEL